MEKYNKLLRNITKLIEKGLFTSKDLKKEVENSLNLKMEIITNKLNLISREEFEVIHISDTLLTVHTHSQYLQRPIHSSTSPSF